MYTIKSELKPQNLVGISQAQIDDHWKLYEGYVNQTNTLCKDLVAMTQEGKASSLLYADRRRRAGFEFNGMVLHEFYFESLVGGGQPLADGAFKKALAATWGSFEAWQNDFINTGKTRGIGWAILYADPITKQLTNHFITEHGNGHIAGFKPILVMDVWEHAYMVDHKADGRAKYIDAFFANIAWNIVEKRFIHL